MGGERDCGRHPHNPNEVIWRGRGRRPASKRRKVHSFALADWNRFGGHQGDPESASANLEALWEQRIAWQYFEALPVLTVRYADET